jgi:acyl-CoA synthetase (AMP-forming)/AMP-acid ligase II
MSSAAVGIVAVNSPAFVVTILEHLERNAPVVPLRRRDDPQRIATVGVREVVVPNPGFGWLDVRHHPRDDDAVAQVLFTSGTEGDPKGVVLTHRALADVVARLNGVMGVDASIREYVGIPVYHSFGFGRCRAVAAAGGKVFIPEHGFNPSEIAAMLERDEINALSAVPSLWRLLLASRAIFGDFRMRLRWAEIGSQAMTRVEKEAVRAIFPRAKIVEHYGLTEASRSTFLEVDAAEPEQLASVGRPVGRTEVRIAADGRVLVRGPHVTHAIHLGGRVVDPRDGDGWYTTNDLGEIQDGLLYYLGRADDVINCGGVKLSPAWLEARVRELLGTSAELAICRVPNAVRGDGILVAVTPGVEAGDAAVAQAAATAAQELGASTGGAIRVARVAELPKTDTGKVQRRKLTLAYAEREAGTAPPPRGDR